MPTHRGWAVQCTIPKWRIRSSQIVEMTMDMLLIAAGFSLIGIGALVAFASHVDPLSGRWIGRARKR